MQPKGKSTKSKSTRRYEQPRHTNAETVEQREQRLARREALTLRAFQMAYENHHQRRFSR
jgi:hypothetical protein